MPTTHNPLSQTLKVQGDGTPRFAEIPRFGEIKGDHVETAISEYLTQVEKRFSELESNAPCIKMRELIDALTKLDDDLDIQWGAVKHLNSVKTNDDIRASIEKMEPKITELNLKISQSVPIYDALVRCLSDVSNDAERRVIELAIRSRKLSGIGLAEDKAKRFNEIAIELSSLTTSFGNNTIDATKKWNRFVTDKATLAGIPDSYLEGFAEKATKEGHENATVENGPWILSVDLNAYLPVIQYADNRELREEVFKARCAIAGPDFENLSNVENINRILKLRAERAEILGYKNHAEVSCAAKMATVEKAVELVEDLLSKSIGMAKKEHEDLQAYAKSKGFNGDLNHWDISYWAEKMKTELYAYNAEDLRPYFVLQNVLDGLFGLLKDLFDIDVLPFEIPASTQWDPEVRMFELKKDDVTRAYCLIDPYVRPGEKNGGAWMNEVCSRNSLVDDRIPVAHVVLNNTPPTATKPSLLNWREVETVFHEMGHALQHMMTQVSEAGVSGIRGIEWDVVELPSQFMENWVYQYELISTFAKHYETGEVLPKDLFDKVERAKNYRAASFITRQLRFGITDLELHSSYDARTSSKTPFDINNEVAERTGVIPPYENDYFLCSFGHIFAGGYSAGYFSYLWAEVMSADAFAAFEEVGLDNQAEVKKMGQKFLNTILALGGSLPPSEVYKLYRGKEASIDALLRHKGLVQ